MNLDQGLLEMLLTTPGISGREERIREVVAGELESLADEVTTDRMGNLVGVRLGNGPKVMVSAHMDSIGFLVSHIEEEGFLRISPVGGFDPRTLVAQRVLVQGRREYVGLLAVASKPIHLLESSEVEKAPKLEDLFVDVMAPADEVEANISVGDPVSLLRDPIFTERAVSAPYLDDRLGVYVLIEGLRRASDTSATIHAVVSVQEEVGLRGAQTAAFGIDPDVGVALDITIAGDIPGSDKSRQVTSLGGGAGIKVMDSGSISDPRLVSRLRDLAQRSNIAHQMEILPRGGTDAGGIQLTRAGVPVVTISTPVRYVHTVNEMAWISDIEASIDLLATFLRSVQTGDLGW